MTTRIADVREALALAASVAGPEVHPYESDVIMPGDGYVGRAEFDPRLVFDAGAIAYRFTVTYFVKRTDEEGGQRIIDDLCEPSGPGSVREAIQDETNWPDDLVHYAQVTQVGALSVVGIGGVTYLSVSFDVEVVW